MFLYSVGSYPKYVRVPIDREDFHMNKYNLFHFFIRCNRILVFIIGLIQMIDSLRTYLCNYTFAGKNYFDSYFYHLYEKARTIQDL